MTHPLTTLRTVDQDPISAMLWADEITDPDDRTLAIQYLCGHLPLTIEEWDEGVKMARAAVRIGAAEEWDGGLVEGMPENLLRWLMADCAEVGIPMAAFGDERDGVSLRIVNLIKSWLATGRDFFLDRSVDLWFSKVNLSASIDAPHWCVRWATKDSVSSENFSWRINDASEYPGYPYVLRRLTYLCKAWAVCGEKAPALLYEGRCPIDWEDAP